MDKQPVDENMERFASEIRAISASVRKLFAGPLTREAMLLLITHAIPTKDRPNKKTVARVLDAAASLDKKFLKGQSASKGAKRG